MKPHPDPVHRALDRLNVPAVECAFIGDSVTDIAVSVTTGVRSIGYAKNPRRGEEPAAARANAPCRRLGPARSCDPGSRRSPLPALSHQPYQPHLSHCLCWSTTRRSGTITGMAAPPASTKTSLQQRLSARARERWQELAGIDVKFRGEFAYVTGRLKDGDTQPLMRLRYGGSAARWGFAVYLASKDGYQDSALPTGHYAGAPEDALDTACGLYLGDPTAWI
jgi:Haloacid dehalogenase-like hydrolase